MPRLQLLRLLEESKPPALVVTIRASTVRPLPRPDDPLDHVPAIIQDVPTLPHVAAAEDSERPYASRIATVLVTCVITLGGFLVVGMLMFA